MSILENLATYLKTPFAQLEENLDLGNLILQALYILTNLFVMILFIYGLSVSLLAVTLDESKMATRLLFCLLVAVVVISTAQGKGKHFFIIFFLCYSPQLTLLRNN